MSVSKPFLFARVTQALGVMEVGCKVGMSATGLPFKLATGIGEHPKGPG